MAACDSQLEENSSSCSYFRFSNFVLPSVKKELEAKGQKFNLKRNSWTKVAIGLGAQSLFHNPLTLLHPPIPNTTKPQAKDQNVGTKSKYVIS